MTTKPMRDSSMELLRIVAMSMILILHFFSHAGLRQYCSFSHYIDPFIIDGVNLFVLISGYYLIKVKWQTILRLTVIILTFHFINLVVCFIASTYFNTPDFNPSTADLLRWQFMPLSATPYWFINVYYVLVIISPLLNAGVKNFDTRQLRLMILVLTFAELYSGHLGHNRALGSYNIFHMLYIYILGYYVGREPLFARLTLKKCVLALAVAWTLSLIAAAIMKRSILDYTNPLVILSSVCIFLIFTRIKIHSRAVNYIASAAVGAYLLQEGLMGTEIIYPMQREILRHQPFINYVLVCVALFVGFWVASIVVMRLIRAMLPLIERPLSRLIDGKFGKMVEKW